MVFSLAKLLGLREGRLEKKEGMEAARSLQRLRYGAFVTRARLHTALESGGVAAGKGRTKSSCAHISSQGRDVKV
jgi:hypothetical protein